MIKAMKTFAKFSTLFFLAIALMLNAPLAQAASHTDETKSMEIRLRGTDRTNIGNAVTAELNANFDAQAQLTVENAAGQRFVETDLMIEAGRNLVKFNISEIPAGIYFIKVNVNGKTETTTFVVSNLNS
jgi:hypothetical protein